MEKTSSQGKKLKQAPRRNMEARREQNRIASRNYREKRKQKLALLNELLEPESANNSSSATSSAPQGSSNSSFGTGAAIIQNDGFILPQPPTFHEASTLEIDISDVEDNVPVDLDISQTTSLLPDDVDSLTIPKTSYPSTHLPDTPFNTMFGPLITDNFTSDNDVPWQTAVPNSASETNLARHLDASFSFPNKGEALHGVLRGLEQLSLNQKRAVMLLLQHQIQYTNSSPTSSNCEQHSLGHDNNDSCLTPHTRMQLEALQFSFALHQTATAGPTSTPSDYVMESGLFSAMFANCYALGMTDIGPLLIDDGWSIFGLGPEVAYHPSQLSVVRAKFRNLAPALRPCDKQLTFPHHPYIDIIPFRTFREKILQALDHDQPLIDEDVLCTDILTGLVCWGSQRNTLGMDAAVPWDVRSWEPKVWFLQKYSSLVGGWDDEMWKGARWWHSMRDERIHFAPTTSP